MTLPNFVIGFHALSLLPTTMMSSGLYVARNLAAMPILSSILCKFNTDNPSGLVLYMNFSMYLVLNFVPMCIPDLRYSSVGTKNFSSVILYLNSNQLRILNCSFYYLMQHCALKQRTLVINSEKEVSFKKLPICAYPHTSVLGYLRY